MNKNGVVFLILTTILMTAAGVGSWAWQKNKEAAPGIDGSQNAEAAFQFVAEARYNCCNGRYVLAKYYKGPAARVESEKTPAPAGIVELSLSDGRKMTLPQTLSGSGARYANGNETLVFWNKGNAAFIHENNAATYTNCVDITGTP